MPLARRQLMKILLAAEAAMDTSPWNYWEADRKTPIGRAGAAISGPVGAVGAVGVGKRIRRFRAGRIAALGQNHPRQ